MPVRTKRWNDPPAPDDGFRLLVCRIRPRGVSKAKETWDTWWPDLGPSRDLLDAFHGKAARRPGRAPSLGPASPPSPLPWDDYARRYLDEMQAPSPVWLIRGLAQRSAAGETITLLCSSACTDPARCHRTLLARLVDGTSRTKSTAARPGTR